MVELSDFIGQIITDIAAARMNSDIFAARSGELYHADPFIKNLPIPHYIIESAEVDVPVIVVGIKKSSDEFDDRKTALCECISSKLPLYTVKSYKYEYMRKVEKTREEYARSQESDVKLKQELGENAVVRSAAPVAAPDISAQLFKAFSASAERVSKSVADNIESYLDSYNFDLVKLLDLSDEFMKCLRRAFVAERETLGDECDPFADDNSLQSAVGYIGNLMFFEFKSIMQMSGSVEINTQTVQMNEYATNDCLMHIKLKVKEQDLTLVTEDEHGKSRRYLSLS